MEGRYDKIPEEHVLCLWLNLIHNVQGKSHDLRVIYESFDVISDKELTLSRNAFNNLRRLLTSDILRGSYHSYKKCLFVLVRNPYQFIKASIEEMIGKGDFFYLTSNELETSNLKNIIFNSNSLHFLNYGHPLRFKESWALCDAFKSLIIASGNRLEDYIVETSMVLAMYGVRKARDLDYSTRSDGDINSTHDAIERHSPLWTKFYDCPINELISNPSNYFVFNGLKFISLERLLQYKKCRYDVSKEYKDSIDIKAINKLLEGKNSNIFFFILRVKLLLYRHIREIESRIKDMIKNILIKLHLYRSA